MLRRLILAAVLVVVLLVAVTPAFAQGVEAEPTVRSQAWDVFVTVALAVSGVVVVIGGIALSISLSVAIRWGVTQFVKADNALVQFGLSPYGMAAYSTVSQMSTKFDDPNDPLVIQATTAANQVLAQAFGILKLVLPVKDTMLTADEVAEAGRIASTAIKELVDGSGLPSNISAEELLARFKNAQG